MKANKTENIKIIKVVKNKKLYKVETNIGDFDLSEDTIVRYIVLADKQFTPLEFDKIIQNEQINSLMNKALNYLSFQSRSKKEIEKYLQEKKATTVQIRKIVSKLEEMGYINDELLVSQIIDYCIRNHKGPKYVIQKLTLKGFKEDHIKKAILIYDTSMQQQVINDLIDKYLEKENNMPIRGQKSKLISKLTTAGFDISVIMSVIDKKTFNNNGEDSLKKDYQKAKNKYIQKTDARNKITSFLIRKGYEYTDIQKCFLEDE